MADPVAAPSITDDTLPIAVALVTNRRDWLTVIDAADGIARIEFCSRVGDAELRIADDPPAAFLCVPFDADGYRVHELAAKMRAASPPVPVVILSLARAARWTHTIPGNGSLHVSRLTSSALRAVLRALLSRERTRLRRMHTAAVCAALMPDAAREALRYAIENGDRRMGVPHLAASIGRPRKSLDRHLAISSPLSAREIIVWGRLMAIAIELDDPGVTVAAIAPELRFTSASSLRNLLQRHTGLTPSELRARGGLREILARFGAVLADRLALAIRPHIPLDDHRLTA